MENANQVNRERVATIVCGAPAKSLAWDMRSDRMLLIGTAKVKEALGDQPPKSLTNQA